jgi:hypothetical protein
VVATLARHHLTCELFLNDASELWRDVNKQICDHLVLFEIAVLQSDEQATSQSGYWNSSMEIVAPGRPRSGSQRIFKETNLVPTSFTLTELLKISSRVNNPQDGDHRPLLFFGTYYFLRSPPLIERASAPRFGHMTGPLTPGTPAHACFPWRVWKPLQGTSPTPTNQESNCLPSCPGAQQVRTHAFITWLDIKSLPEAWTA